MKNITESLGNHLDPEYKVGGEMYNKIIATKVWIAKSLDGRNSGNLPITHKEYMGAKKDRRKLISYYHTLENELEQSPDDEKLSQETKKIKAYIQYIQKDKSFSQFFDGKTSTEAVTSFNEDVLNKSGDLGDISYEIEAIKNRGSSILDSSIKDMIAIAEYENLKSDHNDTMYKILKSDRNKKYHEIVKEKYAKKYSDPTQLPLDAYKDVYKEISRAPYLPLLRDDLILENNEINRYHKHYYQLIQQNILTGKIKYNEKIIDGGKVKKIDALSKPVIDEDGVTIYGFIRNNMFQSIMKRPRREFAAKKPVGQVIPEVDQELTKLTKQPYGEKQRA